MNVYCESCNGTCYCKKFEAEQEAIERLQQMEPAAAVQEMYDDEATIETIAKTLYMTEREVCEILGVDA